MKYKLNTLLIVTFVVNALKAVDPVFAADEAVVPVQPKVIPVINLVTPAAPNFSGSNATMMVTDPFVVNQIKSISKLKSKSSLGNNKRARESVRGTPISTPQVKVIKFPISESSAVVKNTGDKFLFVDITNRGTDQKPVSRIVLSPEIRRLQIEAVRQAAAKRK